MKKTILFLLIILPFMLHAYPKSGAMPKGPDFSYQGNNQSYDFRQQPVKLLEAAYMDHHFWQVDRGITRVNQALGVLDPLYKKDPNQLFAPDKFKHARVYEIKSAVHVLRGLLYQRKAMNVLSESKERQSKEFREMMKSQGKKKLSEKDMQQFAQMKEERFKESRVQIEQFARKAMEEMKQAIDIDKKNPVAYFQYGKLLANFLAGQDPKEAEKQFFMAGKISWSENDKTGWEKSLNQIQQLNPESTFIAELKKLK